MESAPEAYTRRVSEARGKLEALDRRGALIANLRTVTFLLFLGLLVGVAFQGLSRPWLLGSAAGLAGFLVLVAIHARVIREEDRTRVLLSLNERGLQRLDGRWRSFPRTGAGFLAEGHPFAGDLDLFGPGSLFQRLDETGTTSGEAALATLLTSPPPSFDEARQRQGAVRELAGLLDFRQRLVTEARMAGQVDKADPGRFIAWAEAPSGLAPIRWAYPLAHVLGPLCVVLGIVSLVVDDFPPFFWAALAVNLAVVWATRLPLGQLYEALTLGERGFVRFEDTFAAIDAARFQHPLLARLRAGLETGGDAVSARLKRFSRLLGYAELKSNAQVHPLVNALTLWDVLVLFRVDAWREAEGKKVRAWFEALSRLEALSAFGGYAFERPADVFPTLVEGALRFEADGLGHPLLDAPVRNDVAIAGPGQALIITGSNMSGKTTLMRAMGLNAVMAGAGLPVCARALELTPLQVLTSMRVKDSLERGVSYFYAEVQRIKALLDVARQHPGRCLFFLDELFMGTNTRERQVASKHLVRVLLELGASGAITTHDLTLTELEAELPGQVHNIHFRDSITDGLMTFDYRLRQGVVTTTNALEVLRRSGVPVP